ncbi:putative ribonuclease H-like domain-containing protein [Tanacetum coccineum]
MLRTLEIRMGEDLVSRRTLKHCSGSDTESQKEKEDLKAKVEKWHNSSKNLGKLLNTQMSANDKFGLGYGDHRYDGILSYENEVLQSVFMNKESELVNQPLYDRFVTAGGMHVYPHHDRDLMPSGLIVETHESLPEPTLNKPKVVNQPKVRSDAPIIEEYESDSEDEHVSQPTKEQEQPSFASTNKQVKTPRETVKNQFTHSKNPTVKKKGLGYGFTVLIRTGKILVNTARASGTNKVSTARHDFNRHAILTNAAMKVNTVKPIVNRVRPANLVLLGEKGKLLLSPQQVVIGDKKDITGKISPNTIVDQDYPHRALQNKGIVDSGCSRHMTENKAYLAEYQDFNGGPVAFGGSKGYITGKGKIKTGRLDFEDVCFVKELQQFNLFSVSQICDKKNKVLFTDSELRSENQAKTKHAGPQEANLNASTKDTINAGDSEKKMNLLMDKLDRLKEDMKRNANEASCSLRKDTDSPYDGLSFSDPTNPDQDDSEIPALEDIYKNPTDGIFINSSYDDEGAVADFTNLEPVVNVSPIPTSRINSIHPSTLILGDPQSAVQTRKIKAIRIFLAFASYMGFIVYQMDVKSAFLYGKIDEEVYVSQPPDMDYRKGTIDKTLFIKKDKHDIILVQVYVDDIIFGSTKKSWCDEFEALMQSRFQMSSMGELTFFLGLQVKQKEDVCACSRFQVTPKTSHLSVVKRIFRYLKGKPKLGLWYPRVSSFDLEAYSDSDYAGANLDRKSTTGGCQFLGNVKSRQLWLLLLQRQNMLLLQIAVGKFCGFKIKLYHSKTKHIAIRHHFIRDAYEKKLIQVLKIHTDDNVADLTKAFDVSRF